MNSEQLNNKLKRFKFTKPEIFRSSLIETTGERQRLRPWHDKKNDLTDYFNHGFNEHTLQIYAQKVTKMCEKYNETKRQKYVDMLQKIGSGNNIEQLFSRSQLANRELIPMDLGGLTFVVDKKLLKVQDPLSLFFEPNNNEYYQGIMKEQYLCNGDQILHLNTQMNDLKKSMEDCISSLFKKSIKKKQNLYLFDEASKLLPQTTKYSNQYMNVIQQYIDIYIIFISLLITAISLP